MDALEKAVNSLELPGVGEEADWLGRLNFIMGKLNAHKKAVLSELDGPVSGDSYKVYETRWTKRSYNTAALLSAFADSGLELRDLVAAGAVKLSWQWTALRNVARDGFVGLRIAPHEIEEDGDVDAAHVGEVAQSRWKVDTK